MGWGARVQWTDVRLTRYRSLCAVLCADTTATAISFAVYEISRNPGVQAALLEEVDR
jgi:hypothetical protein